VLSAALVVPVSHALSCAALTQLLFLEATLRSACGLCSSWARPQVVAVGTTTGAPTPNVLAALAITDGREPLASDLGVREAAADSPVLPLAPIALGRLTLAPTPTEPLPSPAPSNLATLYCCRHASGAGGASGPSRSASNPARTPPSALACGISRRTSPRLLQPGDLRVRARQPVPALGRDRQFPPRC
jgi:hypothetical protein